MLFLEEAEKAAEEMEIELIEVTGSQSNRCSYIFRLYNDIKEAVKVY